MYVRRFAISRTNFAGGYFLSVVEQVRAKVFCDLAAFSCSELTSTANKYC